MVHEKCYREYARLPEDETVRCLKFHIKNVNTKLYFFTISAYNNFLEFFRVKLIWVPKYHFWDTSVDQIEQICLLRKIQFQLNHSFYGAEILDTIAKVFKTEIIICNKAISPALLTELYHQDRNDRNPTLWLKERLQILFPELLLISYSKNISQIVIGNINNIPCTDFIVSSKKRCFYLLTTSYEDIWKIWCRLHLYSPSH